MKKAIYSFLIAACMLLMLSMTALADWSGDGMSGGQSSAGGYGATGASYNKTGYLIYVADTTGHRVTGTKIVFWPWNGSFSGVTDYTGLKTKAGEFYNDRQDTVVPWGTPLFSYDGTDAMVSNEPIIKQFVVSPYGDCESGGEYLIRGYLGASDAMWDTFKSGDYYLCIEGVMWCGVYGEGWTDTCSGVFAGTSRTWGEKTTNRTNMGKYTHFFLANALYMTQPWMGLTVPSSFLSGKPYYTPDDLKYPSGRGMVAYKIGDWEGGSDLLVKVYQTNDNSVITHDKTEFVSTSKTPTIAQEADYVPIAWETSKEDAATHPRNPLPWDDVRDTSTHTRSGSPSNPPTLT